MVWFRNLMVAGVSSKIMRNGLASVLPEQVRWRSRSGDPPVRLDPDRVEVGFLRSTSRVRLTDLDLTSRDQSALYRTYKAVKNSSSEAERVRHMAAYNELVDQIERRTDDPRLRPFTESFFQTIDVKQPSNTLLIGDTTVYQDRSPSLKRHLFPFVSIEDLPTDARETLEQGYIRRYFGRVQQRMDTALERNRIADAQPLPDRELGRYFDSRYWGAYVVDFPTCRDRQPALAAWLASHLEGFDLEQLMVADCLTVKANQPREGLYLYPCVLVFEQSPARDGGTDLHPVAIAYEERPETFSYPCPTDLDALKIVRHDEGARWALAKTHAMQSAHLIFEIATHSMGHFSIVNNVAIAQRSLLEEDGFAQSALGGFLACHLEEVLGLNALVLSSTESIINCDETDLKFCLPCRADTSVNLIDCYYNGFETSFLTEPFHFDRWAAPPTGFGRYHDFLRGLHAITLRFAERLAAHVLHTPEERVFAEQLVRILHTPSLQFPDGLVRGLPAPEELDEPTLARLLNCVIFDSFRHSLDHETYDDLSLAVLANFRVPIPEPGETVDLRELYDALATPMDRAQHLFNAEFNYSKSLNAHHYFEEYIQQVGYFPGVSGPARGELDSAQDAFLDELARYWLEANTLYPSIKSFRGLARSIHW